MSHDRFRFSVVVRTASVVALLFLTSPHGLSAKPKVTATWNAGAIAVDGNLDDWSDRLVPSSDAPLSIGVANDGDFLYVALASSDEALSRSVFHRGLIVRIRPNGGEDFGIAFPLGTPDRAPGTFILLMDGSTDGQRVAVDNPFGLAMKAKIGDDTFAYELKVPLTRTALYPYALDATPGTKLTLEIETPQDHSAVSGAGPGGGGMGGFGGGGHHGGSMGGGMGGHHSSTGGTEGGEDRRFSAPRPIRLQVKAAIQLANAPIPR